MSAPHSLDEAARIATAEGAGPADRVRLDPAPMIEPPGGPGGSGPAQLACLDSLRGIAILLVIFFHLGSADLAAFHPAVGLALRPFRYGYTGVHLFLVLSGFCLAHSMIQRSRAGRAPSYRAYLAARWRRIAPPYYAAMALYLAIPLAALALGRPAPATGRCLSWRQVSTHALFLHGLWGDTVYAINTPFWSLSLEFQFYLLLPFLMAIAARFGSVAMVGLVAAATVAFRAALAGLFPGEVHLVNGFFLGRLTEFALGMLVAWWYNRRAPGRTSRAALPLLLGSAICLACGIWAAEGPAAPVTDYAFGLGYALLVAAALVGVEAGPRFRRVFEAPWLVWVGVVSYSLYLCHSLVIERGFQVYLGAARGAGAAADVAAFVAVFGLVLLLGWAFHAAVERPFLAKKARRTRG
ncbi:MAG TPA: acyltransferase [Isosphaeraceae bacterium]